LDWWKVAHGLLPPPNLLTQCPHLLLNPNENFAVSLSLVFHRSRILLDLFHAIRQHRIRLDESKHTSEDANEGAHDGHIAL
jgi:hypothetical protein